jgi:hypothetical protein
LALDPPHLRYEPHGAGRALFACQAGEVLLSGPAGTGKSLACLWKLHFLATRVPRLRCLIVRKTRASLTQSVLVTFERDVLPPAHPARLGATRANREAYHYPNGSEVALGGLDKASRIMSSEYDLIYVPEAIELTEDEWESLTTRLRNGVLRYQQLLADTNPDAPGHWLKKRCDDGRTVILHSGHHDNPTLWDGRAWTPTGAVYLGKLAALTGPRKLRLCDGRWVQAEGVIYEGWSPALHLVDRFPVPPTWRRFWSVDFGYTNPFVWQLWALDPDGRLYRTREIYHTGRLVEDHARRILELTRGEPKPDAIVCDHDAEDRATLERHLDLDTVPALKDVSPGLQEVAARLRPEGDGRPRLFYLRDSLDERDPKLAEAAKPCCTEEEYDGYVWNVKGGRRKGEEPLKQGDHGMDATRYVCQHVREDLESGQPIVIPTRRPTVVDRLPKW